MKSSECCDNSVNRWWYGAWWLISALEAPMMSLWRHKLLIRSLFMLIYALKHNSCLILVFVNTLFFCFSIKHCSLNLFRHTTDKNEAGWTKAAKGVSVHFQFLLFFFPHILCSVELLSLRLYLVRWTTRNKKYFFDSPHAIFECIWPSTRVCTLIDFFTFAVHHSVSFINRISKVPWSLAKQRSIKIFIKYDLAMYELGVR